MGQAEVYNVLLNNPDSWFTSQQIYDMVSQAGHNISRGTIIVNISKLYKKKDIERKHLVSNTYSYKIKEVTT